MPLTEGVRIIARAASGAPGDAFSQEIFVQAVSVLERGGREGKVRAEGVRFLDTNASPLAAEDWMKLQIYVGDELDDPHHNRRERRVRITRVVVDAHDARLLASENTGPQVVLSGSPKVAELPASERSEHAEASSGELEEMICVALRERVASWPDNQAQPGGDADWKHVETALSRKVERALVRRLRVGIVPGARDRGRRRNP